MPLEVDATAGAEDANAYADIEAADAHLEFRVGSAAWFDLSDDDKAQALVTAARDIDALEGDPGFTGDRSDDEQALAFPRDGDDELPIEVVRANIELALTYVPAFAAGYTGDVLATDASNGNIKRDKVGQIEVEYFAPGSSSATALSRLPAIVQRLLSSFVVTATTGWGSATVTRGS